MTLLKALLATSGIFGFSIIMVWLGNQGGNWNDSYAYNYIYRNYLCPLWYV